MGARSKTGQFEFSQEPVKIAMCSLSKEASLYLLLWAFFPSLEAMPKFTHILCF